LAEYPHNHVQRVISFSQSQLGKKCNRRYMQLPVWLGKQYLWEFVPQHETQHLAQQVQEQQHVQLQMYLLSQSVWLLVLFDALLDALSTIEILLD
jgi:hypothetical protein